MNGRREEPDPARIAPKGRRRELETAWLSWWQVALIVIGFVGVTLMAGLVAEPAKPSARMHEQDHGSVSLCKQHDGRDQALRS
ncbi:MAG: hypothetical protein ACFB3T_01375 [Geminicoccaceae bacterium]